MFEEAFVLDDDPMFLESLSMILGSKGEVSCFERSKDFYDELEKRRKTGQPFPDLIFLDFSLSDNTSGLDVLSEIKKMPEAASSVIVMVTGQDTDDLFESAHKSGIEWYVEKPIRPKRFLVELDTILYNKRKRELMQPLTGLPGNPAIAKEIKQRGNTAFSCAYIDLDNFKPFNDYKGVHVGDQAILMLGSILKQIYVSYSKKELFVGHIGGDDFILIGSRKAVTASARQVISLYQKEMRQFFSEEELKNGYYWGVTRDNAKARFPLLSLSVGVIHLPKSADLTYPQISEQIVELKKKAKSISGFSVVEGMYDKNKKRVVEKLDIEDEDTGKVKVERESG